MISSSFIDFCMTIFMFHCTRFLDPRYTRCVQSRTKLQLKSSFHYFDVFVFVCCLVSLFVL